MFVSRLAAGGLLLLALLALALDGKPAPQPLRKAPSGGTTALRRELTEQPEASSGPAAGGGRGGGGGGGRSSSKAASNAAPTQPKSKGAAAAAAASAASRLMRDLRPDGKQSRPAWGRMVQGEHHAAGGGGGGGGGGGSRRLKGQTKKVPRSGCFGLKLDRIGAMSGMGC